MTGADSDSAKPKKPSILQRLSLYDIALEGKQIEDILIEADGELTPETEKRMDDLLRSGAPKIEAACLVIKELEATEEAAAEEAQRLQKRRQSFKRNGDGLKERVVGALDAAFSGKVKTARVTAFTQKAKDSILVRASDDVEESALPELHTRYPSFIKATTVYSLNDEAILKIWEDERPAREQNLAEWVAYKEVWEMWTRDEITAQPIEPADYKSAIPAWIEIEEREGRRFLQIR
jgi:hypothetical protein